MSVATADIDLNRGTQPHKCIGNRLERKIRRDLFMRGTDSLTHVGVCRVDTPSGFENEVQETSQISTSPQTKDRNIHDVEGGDLNSRTLCLHIRWILLVT